MQPIIIVPTAASERESLCGPLQAAVRHLFESRRTPKELHDKKETTARTIADFCKLTPPQHVSPISRLPGCSRRLARALHSFEQHRFDTNGTMPPLSEVGRRVLHECEHVQICLAFCIEQAQKRFSRLCSLTPHDPLGEHMSGPEVRVRAAIGALGTMLGEVNCLREAFASHTQDNRLDNRAVPADLAAAISRFPYEFPVRLMQVIDLWYFDSEKRDLGRKVMLAWEAAFAA